MTDDDLQRERLLSYFNGYEAGKADAAKETCVVLTEEERHAIEHCAGVAQFHKYVEHAGALRRLLARSAQPADTVTVRREVLQTLVDCQCDPLDLSVFGERDQQVNAIAQAEAALAKGGE